MILGGGVTGLAAGFVSGLPVYEAEDAPGGICSSYYLKPGRSTKLRVAPADGEAYHFEIGGGHWIFGGDRLVLQFIRSLTAVRSYSRKSAVYFPDKRLMVPYPLQNNLKYFGHEIAQRALCEMAVSASQNQPATTMAGWLQVSFGETLCNLFFDPFHELYTAGLWKSIAPQDSYKSPVDLSLAIKGAFNHTNSVGYNTTFIYPIEGLNELARRMASHCHVYYGKRVVKVDAEKREVVFSDSSGAKYEKLISTLPLNRMIAMAGLETESRPDPSPPVLVINIGARKGPHCPEEHWVYVPHSNSGFHRVGFYSNVDPIFLPASTRVTGDHVSIYVEKSYPEGARPSSAEMSSLAQKIAQELQEWEWIGEVEVIDPTWVDVAYTWSWPFSNWKHQALRALEGHGIYQVGRYGRWIFQGIADSIRDGLMAGGATLSRKPRDAWEGR